MLQGDGGYVNWAFVGKFIRNKQKLAFEQGLSM